MKKIHLAKILVKLSDGKILIEYASLKDKIKFLMIHNTRPELEEKIKKIIK